MSAASNGPEKLDRVSEEQFQKMSNAERLDYARRFPQEQFKTGDK